MQHGKSFSPVLALPIQPLSHVGSFASAWLAAAAAVVAQIPRQPMQVVLGATPQALTALWLRAVLAVAREVVLAARAVLARQAFDLTDAPASPASSYRTRILRIHLAAVAVPRRSATPLFQVILGAMDHRLWRIPARAVTVP